MIRGLKIFDPLAVQFYVNNIQVHDENILSMTPGEVVWIGPITLRQDGYDDGLTVFVDTENQVRECREDNNLLILGGFPC